MQVHLKGKFMGLSHCLHSLSPICTFSLLTTHNVVVPDQASIKYNTFIGETDILKHGTLKVSNVHRYLKWSCGCSP